MLQATQLHAFLAILQAYLQKKNPSYLIFMLLTGCFIHLARFVTMLSGTDLLYFLSLFFYGFQGKKICTISLGPLGHLPIPLIFGMCMGSRIDFGNHVGDWEHMSLFFRGNVEPEVIFIGNLKINVIF